MVVSRRSFMKNGTLLILAAGASLGGAKSIFGRDSEKSTLDVVEKTLHLSRNCNSPRKAAASQPGENGSAATDQNHL